jgi:hypothetical protein
MLIDSLSLLFAFTSFINIYEVALVGLGLLVLTYVMTPVYVEAEPKQPATVYFYLQWSWLGYLRLRDAFWPFFILFNAMLFYVDYRVQQGTYTVASWSTMHIILAMPLVYWTGAVWRCSKNCPSKWWSTFARFMTVAAFADFALRWVIYHSYPNILFNCQQMIIQWGDCI